MTINHPSFGRLDDGRIIIFDTTLRDGEQSPGFSMNLAEKIRMAEALTDLGIDVMEAGFAIASPGDFESVKTIAETIGQRADTPLWSRHVPRRALPEPVCPRPRVWPRSGTSIRPPPPST